MNTQTQDWIQQTTLLDEALAGVLEVFDAEVESELPFVRALVEHVRSYRGKLLRPRLVLLSGMATGELRRQHTVLAAVVEMVHMATLVHDDVLDEADLRRRKLTVNRMLGNESAVLLGDYLISHAYHLCSSLGTTRFAQRVAAVTNTVCEGELMQIHSRGNFALSESAYREIIQRKTASLTSLCCELGAAAAGAGADQMSRLAAFGNDLGMAFQIVDDLIDLTSTEQEAGKTLGRDADLGKLTLPIIRFFEQADMTARSEMIAALTASVIDKQARIGQLLAATDCVEQAMDAARSYVQSALANLSDLPQSPAKEALTAAAEFVLARRS